MVPLITILVTLALALGILRIAAVALTLTGLSRDAARFQALSAFTGVGFTTREAELVVRHPVRRRIVSMLMLLGNVGLVTVAASLIATFSRPATEGSDWTRLAYLGAGLAVFLSCANSRWLDRRMSWLIERALRRWTDIEARDYASLLHLGAGYRVAEVQIEEGDWMAGRELADLDLPSRGILVLGVAHADGRYEGAPGADAHMEPGCTVYVYGPAEKLHRVCGKAAH